jgi:hypothetical protein
VDIYFELENARSSGDQNQAIRSLGSLCIAAQELSNAGYQTWKIWIVLSGEFPSDFLAKISQVIAAMGISRVEYLKVAEAKYFATKKAATSWGNAPFLVFCDSDCFYDKSFLRDFHQAFIEFPELVVYGRTFAAPASSKFENISSYIWLFPPESIGYGGSWPKSRWANNFGGPRDLFQRIPFPEARVKCFDTIELKQERLLWEREVLHSGYRQVEVKATAYHAQFESMFGWLARQFAHGLGTGSRLAAEGKSHRQTWRLVARPLAERIAHLHTLIPASVGGKELWQAGLALRIGIVARRLALVLLTVCRARLEVSAEPRFETWP